MAETDNYRDAQYILCCENCAFKINNKLGMSCYKRNLPTSPLKLCDSFKDKAYLNNIRRKENMTREESLELSKKELKAMQLEALIRVTKEFLETCDDKLEKEVLEQLSSFQDELRDLKVAYQLDF